MYDIDFPLEEFHLNGNGTHGNGTHRTDENAEERAPRGRYQRLDVYDETATDLMASHVHHLLETLGEDPEREGLLKTPERVAKAYQFLTHGYKTARHPHQSDLRGGLQRDDPG